MAVEYLADDMLVKRSTMVGIADALREVTGTGGSIPVLSFRSLILENAGSKSLGTPVVEGIDPYYCSDTIEVTGVTGEGFLYLLVSNGTIAGASTSATVDVRGILGDAFGYADGMTYEFALVVYDPVNNLLSDPLEGFRYWMYGGSGGGDGMVCYLGVYTTLTNSPDGTKTKTLGFLTDGDAAVAYHSVSMTYSNGESSTEQAGWVDGLDPSDVVKIYTSHSSGAYDHAVTAEGYGCTVSVESEDYVNWIITVSGIGSDSYVTIRYDYDY